MARYDVRVRLAAALLAGFISSCIDDSNSVPPPWGGLGGPNGTSTDGSTRSNPPNHSDAGVVDQRDADDPTPRSDAGPVQDAASEPPGDGGDAGKAPDVPTGKLPPVDRVDAMGPFETVIEMDVGPNRGWVVRPSELGKDSIKHPIFTWGAGGGTNASNYRDHLTRLASHGFVVEGHASTGDGTDHKQAIDWLIEQNMNAGSPYYHKLDTTKIASGGHSMGSISTFANASDPRLSTTIHVAGGSFDGNGYRNLKKPAAYFCGANDTLATGNCERDFTNTNNVPVFITVMDGVDHISAAREALPMMVAWLRWHLNGEMDRKAMFVGPSCEFCTGRYKSMSKNW